MASRLSTHWLERECPGCVSDPEEHGKKQTKSDNFFGFVFCSLGPVLRSSQLAGSTATAEQRIGSLESLSLSPPSLSLMPHVSLFPLISGAHS